MDNPYRQTRFLDSVADPSRLPSDTGREIAFAGRSNAGKSSALNTLVGRRRLARTSKTPGRTRLLNFFEVAPQHYLVDLPGYGYAKVPEAVRLQWQRTLEHYLRTRQALVGMVLLLDIRREPGELDHALLDWSNWRELPIRVLLTKADKLKRGPAAAALQRTRAQLAPAYPLVDIQLFSAHTGAGQETLRAWLDGWLFPETQEPVDPAG
ncbi:MAG: ribosome biogenesis GTP-binding protein YihA/YsxC [Candidatus Competibacterales bacterium]|nr:ribosome biogenesis GTP-binding protein YihA/YsxC [Candidatus Competibacterales bacterium]